VFSQSAHETMIFQNGKPVPFGSNLCKNNHNYFGMGKSTEGRFQRSSTVNGLTGEPSYSAKYWNVYQSVFDYYDYTTRRNPQISTWIKTYRTFGVYENQGSYFAFIEAYINKLKDHGYFTGDSYQYSNAVQHCTVYYKPSIARFILCVVYSCFVPSIIVWLFRRFIRN